MVEDEPRHNSSSLAFQTCLNSSSVLNDKSTPLPQINNTNLNPEEPLQIPIIKNTPNFKENNVVFIDNPAFI